jgi:G6PDH family F420-dependent oxidoreductase
MLEEAVAVIRRLWRGETYSHRGRFYTVEEARVYTRPPSPPPILVAASGQRSAELAGRIGDGLISTAPKREVIEVFERAGGRGKPRYGQLTVCWAPRVEDARRLAYEQWPTSALAPPVHNELRTAAQFQQTAKAMIRESDVAKEVVCGPDPRAHIAAIKKFADAGFDHVYVHQVGPDQDGFLTFYRSEILPVFRGAARVRRAG